MGITSQADLDQLADKFANAVFPMDGKKDAVGGKDGLGVSMAMLQAYLLQYKEDPKKAAEEASNWAQTLESNVGGGKKLRSPRPTSSLTDATSETTCQTAS